MADPRDTGIAEAQRRIIACHESGESVLDLSGLGLERVPNAVFQLTELQWLSLSNNRLVALPPELGQLSVGCSGLLYGVSS